PDLVKLDPKLTPLDILKDIVEPSFRINEKYQSYVFEMKSGRSYTGIILEEKNGNVTIIENPLTNAKPLVLKDTLIEMHTKTPVLIMPKGLLDKLTRDEILDLIAYLACRGNKGHDLFRGEAHQHPGSGH